ncbi:MAG: AAA family ATPase [Acidobacteriaceae bacterium]
MLQKIIAIKNVGRFQNSAAGGNTTFKKHTFIHGANGHGKTTIGSILRSLQTGKGEYIVGRKTLGTAAAPEVNLLMVAGNALFDGAKWTRTHPLLAIFDNVFVSENIHSGDTVDTEQKRGLYRVIVGAAGVSLAQQEARLSAGSRSKATETTAIDKALKSHLPIGMKLETFIDLPEINTVEDQISIQESKLKTIGDAATITARTLLPLIELPDVPGTLQQVLSSSVDNVAEGAEKRIAEHLASHGMAEGSGNWISQGLEHTSDSCAFCGQDVRGLPLVADYRAMYGESYRQLKLEIETLASTIERLFGETAVSRLDVQAEQYRSAIEFWSEHALIDPPKRPASCQAAMRNLADALRSVLTHKSNLPLEPLHLSASATIAIVAYENETQKAAAFNEETNAVNQILKLKKQEAGEGNTQSVKTQLERLKHTKTRYSPQVKKLCDERGKIQEEKKKIDAEKATVRAELDKHTETVVRPYQDRINELLENFNAGFMIGQTQHSYIGGVATSSYQIIINNKAVNLGASDTPDSLPSFKNTLSAGDRSTLALAFFIADLERHQFLDSCIVVFDDPFNSQDAFRRRQTVHEIIKVGRRCKQVIVLSHDAGFLKQIWDKCEPAHRVSLGIVDHGRHGSKIMALNLEECCKGRTAADIDDLISFHRDRAGKPIDIYRKMRTVLETYLRTTFPASFTEQEKWLGDMIRKIREEGTSHPAHHLYDDLNEINESAEYHHGEDLSDNTSDTIDPQELGGLVKRTLRIVNALQA